MVKVSVIIPTYNRAFFLTETINSVLKQTYKDFELIIVDDGSTDKTKQLIESQKEEIKYIYQNHKGVSAARNNGIASAIGEYIAFLDSDDLWVENKLEKQMIFFEKHREAFICYTDEIWIRKGRRVNPMKKHAKYSGWIFEKCLPLCIVSPSSVMIKNELFGKIGLFDENLIVCEDYDLWLRISLIHQVYFIDEKLIIKRGGHSDQLSMKMWGNDRYRIMALENILKNPDLYGSKKGLVIKQLADRCDILYNGSKKRGKKEADFFKEKMNQYRKMLDVYK